MPYSSVAGDSFSSILRNIFLGFDTFEGTFWGLGVPLLISFLILVKSPRAIKDVDLWVVAGFSALSAALVGYWKESPEGGVSLHMPPTMLLALAVTAWLGRVPCASSAYLTAFLSLVTADVICAFIKFKPAFDDFSFLYGIGGAGIQDALVIFPILSAGLVSYANWRLKARSNVPPVKGAKTHSL